MKHRQKKALIRGLIILAVFIAAAVLILHLIDRQQSAQYQETREGGTEAFMEEGLVEWNGGRYRKKPAMNVYLIAGVDRDVADSDELNEYRNGGQADFLMLLAVDHDRKEIHQLQIDRDTMTQVMVLGVFGNETGSRELQICLAHSFGATPEDNARYTVRAVRDFLDGIEIDGYYMVDYSAVPTLTNALDGVKVTIPEDMTSVNPDWTEGKTVTLRGAAAETFVRTRQTVGSGTNEERMGRQRIYMQSAIDRMRQKLSEDSGFATRLLSALKSSAVTNLSDQALLEELNQSRSFKVLPADTLPGEHILSETGFIEFYPDEGSAKNWVMSHLYREWNANR